MHSDSDSETITCVWSRDCAGNLATFANGIIFRLPAKVDEVGYVVFPARGGAGSFGFPVRFVGDVFHALRMGATCAADLPIHCRAW